VASALLPFGIYFISALLLCFETWLIASATDLLRHAPVDGRRTVAMLMMLVPLILLPAVPVVLLCTLDYDCRATTRTLSYAILLWVAGLATSVPAYLYARRLRRRPTPV
jgi:hypothetical protein